MMGGRLGENINVREELIKKAFTLSLKAHKSSGKPYLHEKSRGSSEAVFSFPGSYSVSDWFSSGTRPFGVTKIDRNLFPSLRSIGINEAADVHEGFFQRFKAVLAIPSFETEVNKAVAEKKQIVFTGHSSGGATAILATLWFLEKYVRPDGQTRPFCVTFGSPLVGDRIFPHALRREKWDNYFIHFVMRYDIVPRIMLAPLSSMQQELQPVLDFFNPKSAPTTAVDASTFFMTVMKNVSTVASHDACYLMGCTNPLLETMTSFIKLSPYRPFGTYIFCTGNGKLVVLKNPDAVLQLLFYSSQLSSEAESTDVAYRSLNEHLGYENELRECLEMQNVVYLDSHLKELPLTSAGSIQGELSTVNTALNDLGLSTRARLCLRAAGELQGQKQRNQDKVNSINKKEIEEKLNSIQEYKSRCEVRKVGYYDAFKLQADERDFRANVNRQELAGLWDEIIEMLKRNELSDEFEGEKDWITLGTKYRQLVEPLDIANYYRHLKNEDTGPYMIKARPKRYRYTQSWREHAKRLPQGSSSESCFWATVEELRLKVSYEDTRDDILCLEKKVRKWVEQDEIGSDVFLDGSTFTKWWKGLPEKHRQESCLAPSISK